MLLVILLCAQPILGYPYEDVALTGGSWSGYLNTGSSSFAYTAPSNKVFNGLWGLPGKKTKEYHRITGLWLDSYEAQAWRVHTVSMVGVRCTPGQWTAEQNLLGQYFRFECPSNQVLAGFAGRFHRALDRGKHPKDNDFTFRFRCCSLPSGYTRLAGTTVDAGSYGYTTSLNKRCGHGMVMTGMSSRVELRKSHRSYSLYCAQVKKNVSWSDHTNTNNQLAKKHCYRTLLTTLAFATKAVAEQVCEALNTRYGDICLGVYDPNCDGRGYWYLCANRPLESSHSSCVYRMINGRRREETAELDQLPVPSEIDDLDALAHQLGGIEVSDSEDFGGDDIEDMDELALHLGGIEVSDESQDFGGDDDDDSEDIKQ